MEIWKDVPGFEGRYQVSDLGRVYGRKGCLKAQQVNSGYLVVHLYHGAGRVVRTVHSLVADAFVAGHFVGAEVNHKDLDKANNTPSNLEWVTRSQNMQHACAAGRAQAPRFAVVGTPLAGGPPLRFDSQKAAEVALAGRASSAVHQCVTGKKRSAYGYTWSRA